MPLPVSVARPERVARNVRVADMNIDVPVGDARRIEVVCNGLPLWHGAQLAVDATLVSPLTRDGQPQPAANAQPGVALARAEQRKRRHTYPELLRARRCPFVVFGIETGVPPTSRAGPRCQRTCRRVPHCSSRLGVPLEWHPLRGHHVTKGVPMLRLQPEPPELHACSVDRWHSYPACQTDAFWISVPDERSVAAVMASKHEGFGSTQPNKGYQNSTTASASSSSDATRSRFGQEDPLDVFMAELNNQVKEDMSSIGKKTEGKSGPVDKDKAGAMKGAIQHQLKQRYRAKLQQMRGPRSA
eukprot:s3121_g9.t2